uniref:DDE Tnp4 domain-containing protein n=1 Tax=Periophthalmus magnuspinnatus TaxID=409849 RepID=A0A3B4ADH1_9GOBI
MIFLFFICHSLIEEELRRRRRRRSVLFRLNEVINLSVPVLERFFNHEDTRPDFRLSRESLAVLMRLLELDRRWGAELEVLVFLFWLASGTSCRVVSRVFGIPRSTVHCIVHRVTGEVVALRHKVIHLPTNDDFEAVTLGFARLARHRAFRRAAGAVDGCHVRIRPPSGSDGQSYRNGKLFPSIILQAVCDHQGRFIDTYVGWPGSVHDARVLRHSPLYQRGLYPPPGHFILADGGYPCLQHPLPLITPHKSVGAQRFNFHHSKARSIIEHAFGMMKTGFRAIFFHALEISSRCAWKEPRSPPQLQAQTQKEGEKEQKKGGRTNIDHDSISLIKKFKNKVSWELTGNMVSCK